MRKAKTAIGFVGAVVVAFANVPTIWAQSDELPRRLRERISRTLVDEGFPSVAAGGFDTEKKIAASDGAFMDVFGSSVAISGDTAIVGAWFDDDDGLFSGSAYVFRRDEGGVDNWGEVIKITASDAAASDSFGVSVAISGDTAIVGAWQDDDSGLASGSAYLFQQNEGGVDNWGEVTKITASDGEADDWFGRSVSISGDTAIVGAQNDDDQGVFSGSAHVFQRDKGGVDKWGQVTKIVASDGTFSTRFGSSVAISGDTAIVGAQSDRDNDGRILGAAYVFQRDGGGIDKWGEVTKITASDGAGGNFGSSVAISGDIAIVGNWRDGDNGLTAGAAYVFQQNLGGSNNWGEVTKITASDGTADDLFGWSVTISGDTAIVGAVHDDDNGSNSGSAYVFRRDEGGGDNWGEVTKITASDATAGDSFGGSVAISGGTAIVAAVGDDDNGLSSGSAYVLERKPVAVPTVAEWGIMAMTLLMLTGMTIKFGRRRRVTRQPSCHVMNQWR